VGARVQAAEVERAGEPAEQPHAQPARLVVERGTGLLEQLDRALVCDAGTPAALLVADRGAREQLGVAQLASDRRGLAERAERCVPVTGAAAAGAELEQHVGAPRCWVD